MVEAERIAREAKQELDLVKDGDGGTP